MSSQNCLSLSLVLNVAFILALGWTVRPRSRPVEANLAAETTPAVEQQFSREIAATTPMVDDRLKRMASEPIDWSRFSTENWQRFRDELVACGCPRSTIRNIIIPMMFRHYERPLIPLVDEASTRFWDWVCPPFEARSDALGVKVVGAYDECKKAISEVFPDGWGGEPEQPVSNATDERLNYLSPEVAGKIREAEKNRDALINEAQTTQTEPQLRVQLIRQSKDAFEEELARMLTPEALAEWRARSSVQANWVRNLQGVELTPAEMAEIARLREHDQINQKAAADSQIAELLGPEKFSEYRRAQDATYSQLLVLSERTGLGEERLNSLWQLQQAMGLRARQALSETAGTMAERTAEMDAIRGQQEAAVRDLLAPMPGAFEAWQRQQAQWLKNTFTVPVVNPLDEWLKQP